jgi:hypothetical protein
MPRILGQFPGDDPEFRRGNQHASGPISTEGYESLEGFDEPKDLIKVTKDNVTTKIIIKSLTALAYNAGKFPQAIRVMAEQGYEVTRQQMKSWAEGDFAEDYKRIRENFSKQSEDEMVHDLRDTIRQADEAEKLAIARIVEGLEGNKPITAKDASQAAFNLARVKAENVAKLQNLLGRPTVITEDRSVEKAIKKLIAQRLLRPMDADD